MKGLLSQNRFYIYVVQILMKYENTNLCAEKTPLKVGPLDAIKVIIHTETLYSFIFKITLFVCLQFVWI